jgi:hypothetical protein
MAGRQRGQAIPTQLGRAQSEQFVLPCLSIGSRGPAPKLNLFKILNYILRQLYMECQWKELQIERDVVRPERRPIQASGVVFSEWQINQSPSPNAARVTVSFHP